MISAEFLLTAFVVVVVPGTGVVFTVSTALSRGSGAGVVAAIGCTLGIVPHLLAAALGLTALLHTSALVFGIVRYAGVAYLLYLAFTMWKQSGSLELDERAGAQGHARTIGRAVLINLLNPKLTLFFLAFLPQFAPAGAQSGFSSLAILAGVFMLMTLVIFVAYGLLASAARRAFVESSRAATWIQRSFALVLAAFAIRLAIAED